MGARQLHPDLRHLGPGPPRAGNRSAAVRQGSSRSDPPFRGGPTPSGHRGPERRAHSRGTHLRASRQPLRRRTFRHGETRRRGMDRDPRRPVRVAPLTGRFVLRSTCRHLLGADRRRGPVGGSNLPLLVAAPEAVQAAPRRPRPRRADRSLAFPRRVGRAVSRSTAVVLAAVSALHVAWGFGASFPFRSRDELADAVVGTADVPPPVACFAVAVALATGATLVAGVVPLAPRLRRRAIVTMACVLGVRGALGLLGRTQVVAPGSHSERFIRLDRRMYAPLCLALALGCVVSLVKPGSRRHRP